MSRRDDRVSLVDMPIHAREAVVLVVMTALADPDRSRRCFQ